MKLYAFISVFLLVITTSPRSQTLKRDFTVVDSLARSVKYDNDIYRLTRDLTANYTDNVLKARSIFIWITENIKYDYRLFNTGLDNAKVPVCSEASLQCERIYNEWERRYLNKILRTKKAICDGYARLFRKMCSLAGIRCEMIEGYTKRKPYQIGITGPIDHAWNALWLDDAYHLVDATWAAGGCAENEETGKLLSFHKMYNDYYWATAPEQFVRNHFPRIAKWSLLPGFTKEQFANCPFYEGDVLPDIELLSPASGIIEVNKKDTVHFRFEYKASAPRNNIRLQVNTNLIRNRDVLTSRKISRRKNVTAIDTLALSEQQYINYRKTGALYEFDYVVTDNSLYYIDILIEYRRVLRFKVKRK